MAKRLRFFWSNHESRITIHAVLVAALATIAGCGVDTATTAATSASIKKQEVDQGKKTLDDARQKVEQAAQQTQQHAAQDRGASDN